MESGLAPEVTSVDKTKSRTRNLRHLQVLRSAPRLSDPRLNGAAADALMSREFIREKTRQHGIVFS